MEGRHSNCGWNKGVDEVDDTMVVHDSSFAARGLNSQCEAFGHGVFAGAGVAVNVHER